MPLRFLEAMRRLDRSLPAGAWVVTAVVLSAAVPAVGQECPPWSLSGSVTSGDGSTIPGYVHLYIDYAIPGGDMGSYPPGEITVTGSPAVGEMDNVWSATANGYFWSQWGGNRHCERSGGCGVCTGSFALQLFATQGAIDGTVTVKPVPPTGLEGVDVMLVRTTGGAPVWVQTDEHGHFEFRSASEPGRSNNWGVNVDSTNDPPGTSGMASAEYYVAAGPVRKKVTVQSS